MIFTIDRLQFVEGKLQAFEFYNEDTEKSNEKFFNKKIEELKKYIGNGIDELFIIYYRNDFSEIRVSNENSGHFHLFTFEEFSKWFSTLNNNVSRNSHTSKQLGSKRENNIDNYIASILNHIYKDEFEGVDFFVDDNGLGLVKKVLDLNEIPTYGFDCDIFCSNNGAIIEFLKRESKLVSNITAHPARYTYNKQKFVSLWKAGKVLSKGLNSKLTLVNYSDIKDEPLGIITIRDFDCDMNNNKMSLDEYGFKLKNASDLTSFISLLDLGKENANKYLFQNPFERRNYDYFTKVYEQDFWDKNNKWNCSSIGKNLKLLKKQE